MQCLGISSHVFDLRHGRDVPSFNGWDSVFGLLDLLSRIFHQIGTKAPVAIVSIVVVQTAVGVDIPHIVGIRRITRHTPLQGLHPLPVLFIPSCSHVSYIKYHLGPVFAAIDAQQLHFQGQFYQKQKLFTVCKSFCLKA